MLWQAFLALTLWLFDVKLSLTDLWHLVSAQVMNSDHWSKYNSSVSPLEAPLSPWSPPLQSFPSLTVKMLYELSQNSFSFPSWNYKFIWWQGLLYPLSPWIPQVKGHWLHHRVLITACDCMGTQCMGYSLNTLHCLHTENTWGGQTGGGPFSEAPLAT